jgi:4-aminobutyrate aminotransferase
MSHLSNVWFKVTDLEVVSGRGCRVTTADGEEYLDFAAGIAVNSTGHSHPHVVDAIARQAGRFIHAQVNVFTHDLLEPLAAQLAELAPGAIDTFFFANSGAEITEAAVKLAKQVTGRPNIIVFDGSFHGRTHLAMAMTTSKTVYRAGHAPLPSGVFVAPFPDPLADDQDAEVERALGGLDQLLAAMTAPAETAAMILEPVLGEGGYIPAPRAFLEGILERCRQHGILFIADEVQTGMGRTGTLWGIEHWGVAPDIMTMGKALGGAVIPVGCFISTPEVFEPLMENPYIHTTTFGGNPMATSAVIGALHATLEEDIPRQAAEKGAWFMERFEELRGRFGDVLEEVRGIGLLIGLEFVSEEVGYAVATGLFGEGVLTGGTLFSAKTFRIEPPATLTQHELEEVVARLERVMGKVREDLRAGQLTATH